MKTRAMTLMELLIVMAVLAVLIGIPFLSFRGLQNEGKTARARGDLRTLRLAIESYYKNNRNLYPGLENYLTTLLVAVPQIVDHPLYDPFGETNTTPYSYALSGEDPSSSRYFIVYSVGPRENGSAMVDSNGQVTASSEAIWDSNGRL